MADLIKVEVAYATPEKQLILEVEVNSGATVFEAAEASGITDHFPDIELSSVPMGIFGKKVAKPKTEVIQAGQRVELYRPLLIDPKQARANRAAKKAKEE